MPEIQWFIASHGVQQGPLSDMDLRQCATDGRLNPDDLVWRDGMSIWLAARTIRGLIPAQMPPPLPAGPQNAPPPMAMLYTPPPGYHQPDIGQNAGMRMILPVGRSGWAIAAGYLGLVSFVVVPAPVALIISIIAILDIKKHPDRHGMGRAIFGLIMGILGTVALGIALVYAIVG